MTDEVDRDEPGDDYWAYCRQRLIERELDASIREELAQSGLMEAAVELD